MVHSKTHGIPKKTHIYCARKNFCNILLNLQGSHKPHCLRKKENIGGYKTYFATLPSHPTPTPLKSNTKFIFKVPSSLLFLWFCFFLEHKIIETTLSPAPPTHLLLPKWNVKFIFKAPLRFYCYPFILLRIKILTQNLYLRLKVSIILWNKTFSENLIRGNLKLNFH